MGFWPKLSGHTATNPFAEFDKESVCFVRGFWLANKVNDNDIIKIRQIIEKIRGLHDPKEKKVRN